MSKEHQLALQLAEKEDHQGAISIYNKLLIADPENADLYNDRGVSEYHLGNMQAALDDMNKALAVQPDYGYRFSARAYIRDRMGDTKGAVEDYSKAVEMDPEDAIAFNNLGLLEEKLGHIEKAKRRYKQADDLAERLGIVGGHDYPNDKEKGSIGVRKIENESGSPVPLPKVNKELAPKAPTAPPSTLRVMLDVFRKKEAFQEFLQFIRSGFSNKKQK